MEDLRAICGELARGRACAPVGNPWASEVYSGGSGNTGRAGDCDPRDSFPVILSPGAHGRGVDLLRRGPTRKSIRESVPEPTAGDSDAEGISGCFRAVGGQACNMAR